MPRSGLPRWVECKRRPRMGEFVTKRMNDTLVSGVVREVSSSGLWVYGKIHYPPLTWTPVAARGCTARSCEARLGRDFNFRWNNTARVLRQV